MFGRIDKTDTMAGIPEKGGTRGHRLENARLVFDAQLIGQMTKLGDQPDQTFGLMGIELIQNKGPCRVGIGGDGLGHGSDEIGFGAGRANGGCHNLSGGDVQIGNQGLGALSNLLKFALFDLSRPERLGGRSPLQGLNPRHFIGAQPMLTPRGGAHRVGIDFADGVRLLLEDDGIFLGGVEPIPAPMRLNIGLVLINAPLVGRKCSARSRVASLPEPPLSVTND